MAVADGVGSGVGLAVSSGPADGEPDSEGLGVVALAEGSPEGSPCSTFVMTSWLQPERNSSEITETSARRLTIGLPF